MNRIAGWEERLATVFEMARREEFIWGKNDCLHLVGDTVEALTGKRLLDGYSYNSFASAMILLNKTGENIRDVLGEKAADLGFQVINPLRAMRGDVGIIIDGNGHMVCAVCAGDKWICVTNNGLVGFKPERVIRAWHIGESLFAAGVQARIEGFEEQLPGVICEMPPAIFAVAGAALSAIAGAATIAALEATTLGLIAGALVSTAVSMAFSFIGAALFPVKTPKPQDYGRTATGSFVQPITSRKWVYGKTRVGGPLVYYLTRPAIKDEFEDWEEKDSDNKNFIHLIPVFAGHECQEIHEFYFNDEAVGNIVNHWATSGRWLAEGRSRVYIDYRLGGSGNEQSYDMLIVRSQGAVTGSIVYEHPQTDETVAEDGSWIKIGDDKWYFRKTLTGAENETQITTDTSDLFTNTADKLTAYATAHPNSDIGKATYLYRDDIGSDRVKVRIRVTYNGNGVLKLDTSDEPRSYMNVTTNKLFKKPWASTAKGYGMCHAHVMLEYHDDVFSTNVPSISAVVSGKKLYDPRLAAGSAKVWSDNAALCILDYLITPTKEGGLGADLTKEIDKDSFIGAANICDELVETTKGQEKRYTCNGIVDLDAKPVDILNSLLTSCAGLLIYSGGLWRLVVGAWNTPIVGLSDEMLRDPIKIVPWRSRKDLVNTVGGAFNYPDSKYTATDYPTVKSTTYITQDGGDELKLTLDQPFCTSEYQAQRIARIALEKVRRQLYIEFPATLAGMIVRAGDTIYLNFNADDRFGFQDKPMIVTSWRMTEDMGIDISLQEDHSSVYSHDASKLQELDIAIIED